MWLAFDEAGRMMSALLDHLDDDDRRRLISVSARRRFRRREVVFHQDDPGDTIHIVLQGLFMVELRTAMGESLVVRLARPGDVFGELVMVSANNRRTATVVALEPSETRVIDASTFDILRRRSPALDRFLLELLAARLEQMNAQLVEAYFLPVERRVFRRLLDLDIALRRAGASSWIHITQNDIAAMSGTTRQTVNRILVRGRDEGMLELGRGRFRVIDTDRLTREAQ